jgi:hypothetical protein
MFLASLLKQDVKGYKKGVVGRATRIKDVEER